jgi:xanthine dehydrogenase YagR molybdenum-binding subunit
MIWGAGAALMEETVMDPRHGHFVNHDLAEYQVAVNADVPEIDAVFLDELDDKGNPLGIKEIGELGICGAGAAVANAVYNATGVRVDPGPGRQGRRRHRARRACAGASGVPPIAPGRS